MKYMPQIWIILILEKCSSEQLNITKYNVNIKKCKALKKNMSRTVQRNVNTEYI